MTACLFYAFSNFTDMKDDESEKHCVQVKTVSSCRFAPTKMKRAFSSKRATILLKANSLDCFDTFWRASRPPPNTSAALRLSCSVKLASAAISTVTGRKSRFREPSLYVCKTSGGQIPCRPLGVSRICRGSDGPSHETTSSCVSCRRSKHLPN